MKIFIFVRQGCCLCDSLKNKLAKINLNELFPNIADLKEIDIDSLDSVFNSDEINKLDGIKFIWDDRGVHFRKSNTEPIMRIYAEAPDQKQAEDLVDKIKEIIYMLENSDVNEIEVRFWFKKIKLISCLKT